MAVELTFNAAGSIVDAQVLSGPEELRKVALESALRESYSINVARTQGAVENLRVVAGHPLLIQAAIEAVKQWRYEPQPEAVTTSVTVNFALQ